MRRFSSALISLMILLAQTTASKASGQKKSWNEILQAKMKSIEATVPPGSTGLYIKNLRTGKEFSLRGDEIWYFASGIKIPVALEVLRQIDLGSLTLATKVEVLETDYIDGAGELNYLKPGSKVSVRLLLDQSLTFSDNTATDMLIRLVGLEKINALTASLAPRAFTPITTLIDVRRNAYGEFHPAARSLSNMDFIRIRVAKDEKAKLDRLAKLLKISRSEFKYQNLDSAFEAYYAKRLNSGTLRGFGLLLEKVSNGLILKSSSKKHLLDTLERVETGEKRIKAGLPKSYTFAHKTGTQHRRFCDMGLLSDAKPSADPYVVVSCVRKLSRENAEKVLNQIGLTIYESQIFKKDFE